MASCIPITQEYQCDHSKENIAPHSQIFRKQSKRRVLSSSSADSDTETNTQTSTLVKRSKLATAEEILANEDITLDGKTSVLHEQNSNTPSAISLTSKVREDSDDSDADNDTISNKRPAKLKRSVISESDSDGEVSNGSRTSKSVRRTKKPAVVEDDSCSDDEMPKDRKNTSLSEHSVKLNASTLDPNLFDAEDSSNSDSSCEEQSEEEEITNKLSSKYSGPAAKKESKAAKRAVRKSAQRDEKLKIYSEKQRMIREQTVTVPVYQPPKKSLREFLSEQAPQLLKALKQPSQDEKTSAPKHRLTAKPPRPPKHLEHMEYLEDSPLLYTPAKKARSKAKQSLEISQPGSKSATDCLPAPTPEEDELPDILTAFMQNEDGQSQQTDFKKPPCLLSKERADNSEYHRLDSEGNSQLTQASEDNSQHEDVETQGMGDNSQMTCGDNSQMTCGDNSQYGMIESSQSASCVTVVSKSSPMRRRVEAKKLKLRKLLGDTVDLDLVPQLSCDSDGVVVLGEEQTVEKRHFKRFKSSFEEKAAKAKLLEEERKRQREKQALRVVKNLPDGSQHEISMDAYSSKTAEETGGVHKLAVLKQILHAKLSEKRDEEIKRKEETIKLEALEEELPEDEILDEDYVFSDDEEKEDNSDHEEVGPVLHESDGELNGLCEFEKDEALMRRVRAVLDSDDEDGAIDGSEKVGIKTSNSYSSDRNRLAESHVLDSLDRMLGQETAKRVDSVGDSNQDIAKLSEKSLRVDGESTQPDSIGKMVKSVDENAQDFNFPFKIFTSTGGDNKAAESLLTFTQGMFNTQQAESELEGLCSGQFGSPTTIKKDDSVGDADTHPKQSQGAEATTKVVAKKKQALQFSDEESEGEEDVAEEEEKAGSEAEMDDEPESIADDSERESLVEEEENEELAEEEKHSVGRHLVLQKPRQTKREKLLGEYLEREAELSGDEGGSDEDLDLSADADVLEMEKGDLDYVGKEEQLRAQVAKTHLKQRVDDDARELMLMKEMLLPDGDLHSDSKRQRKFRWRNVDYGADLMGSKRDNSDDSDLSGDEGEMDAEVKQLQERLLKERAEREAWLKDQRDKRVQQVVESQSQSPAGVEQVLPVDRSDHQVFTFNLGLKKKKPGYVLGKSKKYLERFKELHKNIKEEQRGPISHKNLVFRPISKEDAESQQEMLWKKS